MLLYDIILFLPFLNGSHWKKNNYLHKWRIGKKLKWNNTTIKMKKKRKKPTINVRVRWSEVLLLSVDYLSDVRIFKLWGKKLTFVFNNWTFNLGSKGYWKVPGSTVVFEVCPPRKTKTSNTSGDPGTFQEPISFDLIHSKFHGSIFQKLWLAIINFFDTKLRFYLFYNDLTWSSTCKHVCIF